MELRDRLKAIRTKSSEKDHRRIIPSLDFLTPVENPWGRTYFTDKIYIESHGPINLKNFPDIRLETLRFLSRDPTLQDFSLRKTLFLDIETTGTAGGTGTYAFLVGLGSVKQGYFQIRQYFLHDLAQEEAFLYALEEYVSNFWYLISYNGKCFDTQILRNRFLMHRRPDPLEEKKHIDMLPVARRIWKKRFFGCDLINLERHVLQWHRPDDIPGYRIPSTYVEYLRGANISGILRVLEHNRWDILSLAVLTARACSLPAEKELAPEEHYALSLLYERQKEYERAVDHQIAALKGKNPCKEEALVSLARNLRRMKDSAMLQWLVRRGLTVDQRSDDLCRRLAIICEHDLKDPELALRLVEEQLAKKEKYRQLSLRVRREWDHWMKRKERLAGKLERSGKRLL